MVNNLGVHSNERMSDPPGEVDRRPSFFVHTMKNFKFLRSYLFLGSSILAAMSVKK